MPAADRALRRSAAPAARDRIMQLASIAAVRRSLVLVSLGLLLLVGAAGESAAAPGLGPRGWAPGTLGLHLSSALVTTLLYAAYLLGALAVGCGLAQRSGPVQPHWGWAVALGVAVLFTCPIGSADHINYAAYGRISAQGGNPYVVAPVTWAGGHDPVTSAVQPPWTRTPSVYGPFATLLQRGASLVGGSNLRQTVWIGQVLVVLAWLAVRALLLRAAQGDAERRRVDVLWTFNPMLVGAAVVGAHVDVIATALALAAILVASRSPWAGGLVVGLALSTKVTYAVVAVAILWSWRGRKRPDLVRRVAELAVGALLVLVPLHLWAGAHVFDQLLRARRAVSMATPWRIAVDLLTGPIASATVRTLVSTLAAVVTILLALALAVLAHAASRSASGSTRGDAPDVAGRRSLRDRSAVGSAAEVTSAVRTTFVLGTAYTLGAPYSLPWYDALTWATLPLVAAPVLDWLLTGRLAVMTLAYVPGRVIDVDAGVQAFTLGVRRHVAPYVGLLVWALLTALAARARAADGRLGWPLRSGGRRAR